MKNHSYDREINFFGIILSIILAVISGHSIVVSFTILSLIMITMYYSNSIKLTICFSEKLLLGWLGFAALSSSFSIDSHITIISVIKFSLILIISLITIQLIPNFQAAKLKINKKFVIIIFIFINLLMIYEHLNNFSLNLTIREIFNLNLKIKQPLDKSGTFIAMLLPTFSIYLRSKTIYYYLFIFTSLLNFLIHPMLACSLIILTNIGVIFCSHRYKKPFIIFYLRSIILFLCFTPLFFCLLLNNKIIINSIVPNLPLSWIERVEMWQKTTKLIAYRPIFGIGFNASEATNNHPILQEGVKIQLHPHNMFLQMWLELGILGVLLFALFLNSIFNKITTISRPLVLYSYLGLINAIFVLGLISFGISQTWLICSFFLAINLIKLIALEDELASST